MVSGQGWLDDAMSCCPSGSGTAPAWEPHSSHLSKAQPVGKTPKGSPCRHAHCCPPARAPGCAAAPRSAAPAAARWSAAPPAAPGSAAPSQLGTPPAGVNGGRGQQPWSSAGSILCGSRLSTLPHGHSLQGPLDRRALPSLQHTGLQRGVPQHGKRAPKRQQQQALVAGVRGALQHRLVEGQAVHLRAAGEGRRSCREHSFRGELVEPDWEPCRKWLQDGHHSGPPRGAGAATASGC